MTNRARIGMARSVLLGAVIIHLALIATISIRELSWLIANKLTSAPARWIPPAQTVNDFTVTVLGESLAPSNLFHAAVATYLNVAGIQGGYGFFAPNVTDSYKLSFYFGFIDGHVEEGLPYVSSEESALRLSGLLDEIGRTRVGILRDSLVKLLATEAWEYHPDAVRVRAVFSSRPLSSATNPQVPAAEEVLYTFEFARK